jgi:hypothetical protein
MQVRNRNGDPVDPVPFLVSAGLVVMFSFSAGPLFGLSYGLSVPVSLCVACVCSAVVVTAAFYRLVWTATARSVSVPAQFRFERILYLAVAFGLVLLALSIPLLF